MGIDAVILGIILLRGHKEDINKVWDERKSRGCMGKIRESNISSKYGISSLSRFDEEENN